MLACSPRPNIAFQCVASDMWRENADTHACVCVQDARIPSQDAACVASDMWRGNADTDACVCVQDARIPSQDAAYTLATLDDLCTVCNTCQFIPLRLTTIFLDITHARMRPTPKHSIPVCGVRYAAWERRHPCVCVRPGRTNPQPRRCVHISNT